jgi:methylmalonyl-CoA/ethylmalonyl-CoA epimerase
VKENSTFSKFHHVALVVRDMDKAIAHYQSLGIGPFRAPPVEPTSIKLYGKPIPTDYFTRKETLGKMGPINLQLVQPGEEESTWKEFLETKGEGVHHLGFFVDDIEKEEAEFAEKGFEIIISSRFKGGGGAAYIDIGKEVGGIIIELIQSPPHIVDSALS